MHTVREETRGLRKAAEASVELAFSLGKFFPSRLHEVVIFEEMSKWLNERGIGTGQLPIGVRRPEDHLKISSQDEVVQRWHRDGLGKRALDRIAIPDLKKMILWSNKTSTQLMEMETGKEYDFEPFDIIVVNNQKVLHRCPPPEEDRWFARLLEPIGV